MIDQVTPTIHYHGIPDERQPAYGRFILRCLPLVGFRVDAVDVYATGIAVHGRCWHGAPVDRLIVPDHAQVLDADYPLVVQVAPLGRMGEARN